MEQSVAVVRLRPRPVSGGEAAGSAELTALLRRLCILMEELVALQRGGATSAAAEACEPISPVALGSLSRAERELVELVGVGLSNKEIAGRRATSVKTVKGQLTGVYRKLGVTGRGRLLARWR